MRGRWPGSMIVGIAAACLGAWWCWDILLQPLLKVFSEPVDAGFLPFALFFLPVLALPGILTLYSGLCLCFRRTGRNIIRTIGSLAFAGAWALNVGLYAFAQEEMPKLVFTNASMLLASLIMIPLYLIATRFLLCREGMQMEASEGLLGKPILGVVAFMVWNLSSALFMEYMPVKEGTEHVPEMPWGILAVFVPILLAWGFYRVAVKMLKLQSSPEARSFRLS